MDYILIISFFSLFSFCIVHNMENTKPTNSNNTWNVMSGLSDDLLKDFRKISLEDQDEAGFPLYCDTNKKLVDEIPCEIAKEEEMKFLGSSLSYSLEGPQPFKQRVIDAYRKKISKPTGSLKKDVILKRQSQAALEGCAYRLMKALADTTESRENIVQRERDAIFSVLEYYLVKNLDLHDELDLTNVRINEKIIAILQRYKKLKSS
jgi:hypothetical protein